MQYSPGSFVARGYETFDYGGKVYVTLRSLCEKLDKRSEHIIRRLRQGKKYSVVMLPTLNSRGQMRATPCVLEMQAPAISAVLGDKTNIQGRKGSIYFVQQGDHGPIKIGWSINPNKRFGSLQTDNPDRVRLLGTIAGQTLQDEQSLLGEFNDLRIHGEWFHPEQPLLRRIRTLLGTESV